jgi:hypothetical protein
MIHNHGIDGYAVYKRKVTTAEFDRVVDDIKESVGTKFIKSGVDPALVKANIDNLTIIAVSYID